MIEDRTGEVVDLQIHSLVHGVISLESKAPTYGKMHREMQVTKFRGSDFISGFHDFVIRRGGVAIFPRLVAAAHGSPFPPEVLLSGVAELDALLGGGIDRGTSTLLMGPPGSGKSTLALQYAAAAVARGDHAATFVFDETKHALLKRSAGIGLNFKKGPAVARLLSTLSIRWQFRLGSLFKSYDTA